MILSYSNKMNITCFFCLRHKTKKISNYLAVIFYNKRGIPKFVYKHWMMVRKSSIITPKILYVCKNL